ncbi:MAG: hypothetical protein Q4G58_03415 [bacterium]|nr:hypothetical protein [bacterium]
MRNKKRYIAILACVLVLLMPFLSENYIVKNKKHHCPRRECPICMELQMAEYLMEGFKTLLPILAAGLLLGIVSFVVISRVHHYHRTPITLITLKVELLN